MPDVKQHFLSDVAVQGVGKLTITPVTQLYTKYCKGTGSLSCEAHL